MNTFSKKSTLAVKGVAILMLIWHHLFFIENASLYDSMSSFGDLTSEFFVATFCKSCVAIFLFLSGFGLFKSFEKYNNERKNSSTKEMIISDARYVLYRLVKLLSDYWIVFIIFVPLGLLFGRKFYEIYGANPFAYLADMFGVSYLFFGFSKIFNVTWWYMSVIIVYYICFPILYRIEKFSGELLLAVVATVLFFYTQDFRELILWLLPFVLGIYFADKNIFEYCSKKWNKSILLPLVINGCLVSLFGLMRCNVVGSKIDGLFAIPIIMLSAFVFDRIPVLNKILESLGKYSGMIFMFHTFISGYYLVDELYSLKNPLLIYFVMIVSCYIISLLLNLLKKVTKYDVLINRIGNKILGSPKET